MEMLQARLGKERVAKEKVLAQTTSIKKGKEQLAARMKSEEDKVRKKAANDLQKYVEDIAGLENELAELKPNSKKIEAIRKSLLRTITVKGNKKSDLKREEECVMCLSEEMSVVFLPCAHQVVCPECNKLHEKQGTKECPSCRVPIERRIHARFAHIRKGDNP